MRSPESGMLDNGGFNLFWKVYRMAGKVDGFGLSSQILPISGNMRHMIMIVVDIMELIFFIKGRLCRQCLAVWVTAIFNLEFSSIQICTRKWVEFG